jgi:FkbM family methyltransferase
MKPAAIDPPQVWPQLWQGFSGHTGWDIGANCGQTIPVMLEKFDHVVAFEPAVECASYLFELGTVDTLTYLPYAVSDTDGEIDLLALPDKIDTGQLVTAGTHGMEWNPDRPDAVIRTVTARSVDSLIADNVLSPPDFMKIDVEGHELKVLFGAKRTLALTRPDLLIEFHSHDLHRLVKQTLDSYGYTCATIRHPHYQPGTELWFGHGWIRATTQPDRVRDLGQC